MKLNKNETFSLKNSYFLIYEFLEFMTHFITVVGIVLKSLNVVQENKNIFRSCKLFFKKSQIVSKSLKRSKKALESLKESEKVPKSLKKTPKV